MLHITIDSSKGKNTQAFIEVLAQFCKNNKLIFIIENSIINLHLNDESELAKTILKQNKITLSDEILNQIIEKAFHHLDLSDTSCYLVNNLDEIEQLIDIDTLYDLLAFTLEDDKITNVFFCVEGNDDMMTIIFYEESSDIKQLIISNKIPIISQ